MHKEIAQAALIFSPDFRTDCRRRDAGKMLASAGAAAPRPHRREGLSFAGKAEPPAMQELTPEGRQIVQNLANAHGVSFDAVLDLLLALVAGGGLGAVRPMPISAAWGNGRRAG